MARNDWPVLSQKVLREKLKGDAGIRIVYPKIKKEKKKKSLYNTLWDILLVSMILLVFILLAYIIYVA